MADTKSSTSTGSSAKGKTTTARKKSTGTAATATQDKAAPAGGAFQSQSKAPGARLNLDPEHVGRALHRRTAWIDEILAILFIVFGLVTILSLLNNTSTSALSTMWSEFVRQLFGFVGTILISFMIMAVGVLIFLPRMRCHGSAF